MQIVNRRQPGRGRLLIHRRAAIFGGILLVVFAALADTLEEPARPAVDGTFDAQREAKVRELAHQSIQEVFAALTQPDFFVNERLLNKAIFTALGHRRREAIAVALERVRSPRVVMIEGRQVVRAEEFQIAKTVLQVFPDEALPGLLALYRDGAPEVRANVIRVVGKLAGGQKVKELLIKALDDKTFYEKESAEMQGVPLRVCDLAYNQLVLRYRVKNVLRTIGIGHNVDTREYHIGVLKDVLSKS